MTNWCPCWNEKEDKYREKSITNAPQKIAVKKEHNAPPPQTMDEKTKPNGKNISHEYVDNDHKAVVLPTPTLGAVPPPKETTIFAKQTYEKQRNSLTNLSTINSKASSCGNSSINSEQQATNETEEAAAALGHDSPSAKKDAAPTPEIDFLNPQKTDTNKLSSDKPSPTSKINSAPASIPGSIPSPHLERKDSNTPTPPLKDKDSDKIANNSTSSSLTIEKPQHPPTPAFFLASNQTGSSVSASAPITVSSSTANSASAISSTLHH